MSPASHVDVCKRYVWGITTMKAIHGRLACQISCARIRFLCDKSRSRPGLKTLLPLRRIGGACPTASATFIDPLSAPHWNGWGVDPAQHRFQPPEMAQLAADDVPHLKLKWAFGFPGAEPSCRSADDRRRPHFRRQPGREGLFARRQKRMHLLGVRRRCAGAVRHRRRPGLRTAGRPISATWALPTGWAPAFMRLTP